MPESTPPRDQPVVRHALYFAPRHGSAWDRFGAAWLGRCAYTAAAIAQPVIAGVEASRLHALTDAPRRYGFHATLKAPFRLVDGATPEQLLDELRSVFARRPAFDMPALQARRLGGFLALVPAAASGELDRVARDCVMLLDRFRQPAGQADIERRRAAGLSAQEEANLLRWGYPYVMESFRFHFSLTGPVGEEESVALIREVRRLMPAEPLRFDAVTVFTEASPGAAFRITGRVEFEQR